MKSPQSIAIATTTTLLILLAGCTGLDVLQPQPDDSVFYILGVETADAGQGPQQADRPAILVGPSSLAKYLDQSHIVSFEGTNELVYSDQHRWAEPLREGIDRLLINRLSADLATFQVATLRNQPGMVWDYRVGYQVQQLGGKPGDSVRLDIAWWIRSKDDSITNFKTSLTDEGLPGNSMNYRAYVQSIESLLDAWAAEVASAIRDAK